MARYDLTVTHQREGLDQLASLDGMLIPAELEGKVGKAHMLWKCREPGHQTLYWEETMDRCCLTLEGVIPVGSGYCGRPAPVELESAPGSRRWSSLLDEGRKQHHCYRPAMGRGSLYSSPDSRLEEILRLGEGQDEVQVPSGTSEPDPLQARGPEDRHIDPLPPSLTVDEMFESVEMYQDDMQQDVLVPN